MSFTPIPVDTQELLAIGDFDNNGRDDLLVRDIVTGAAETYLSNANGSGGYVSHGSLNTNWSVEGVGDFNGDGTDDVLLHNSMTDAVGAWKMNNGVISDWFAFGTANNYDIKGVGDFNGDGTDDVLLQSDTGATGAWRITNGAVGSWWDYGSVADQNQIFDVADMDGDGDDDIIWQIIVDQPTYGAWQMGNGNVGGWINLPTSNAVVGVGNFDNDAANELLEYDYLTNTYFSSVNVASGQIYASLYTPTTSTFSFEGVGNFDGAGADNLLFFDHPGPGSFGYAYYI